MTREEDLKEYSILQLLYAGTLPAFKSFRIEYSFRWKWNYRHNPVQFFLMRWEIKRRKNGKKTFTQIVAVVIFQKMSNDCKSNVSAHQSCTIEVFPLEKKLHAYLVGLPEYCNIWKCFTNSFEAEK